MYAVAWAGAFQRHNAGSASLPPSFSASHLDAAHCCSAPPPRTACRSIRLLCGSGARFLPLVTRCVVAAARRVNGTGGEGKRCLDGNSSRGNGGRDHGGQGEGGEGADQHRLQIAREVSDGSVDELPGSVHTT